MQTSHRCFFILTLVFGVSWAAENIKPDPPSCELVVNDFSQLQSTTKNSMGFLMSVADGLQLSLSNDSDPRVILTPNSVSSFSYSFVRKPGQCFDASNFDYISLELKTDADVKFVIGYSSNPVHCDETTDSVVQYSLASVNSKKEAACVGVKTTVDIPFSRIPGDATKNNIYAIVMGGLVKPIELYSIKLKGACASDVSNATIALVRNQNTPTPESSDAESQSDIDDNFECSLAIEDFANEDVNVNAQRGTHGTDGTMTLEIYSADNGLQITSANSSSYWYTVIPCMKFNHYDVLALNVAGPKGGDFAIRLKAKEGCDTDFKDFRFWASQLLDGKLIGEPQRLLIPFDKLNGFDKKKHTIGSIIVGDFLNEGDTHDNATPMDLNIKFISLRGENCDSDDEEEEHVQANEKNEKEKPSSSNDTEESTDTYSSSSRSVLSIAAVALVALLITV